ncbi:hypothetical protein ABZ716_17850 [Streptomyces sp. NPDC006687]
MDPKNGWEDALDVLAACCDDIAASYDAEGPPSPTSTARRLRA